MDEEIMDGIDPEKQKGAFSTWVISDSVRRYIKRNLSNFILKFQVEGRTYYFEKLKDMCINNRQSLIVEYEHLKVASPMLVQWLVHYPLEVIPEYNAAIYAIAGRTFPSYKDIIGECYFKLCSLPVTDSLRLTSFKLLGQLVKVKGVITHIG